MASLPTNTVLVCEVNCIQRLRNEWWIVVDERGNYLEELALTGGVAESYDPDIEISEYFVGTTSKSAGFISFSQRLVFALPLRSLHLFYFPRFGSKDQPNFHLLLALLYQ